MQTDAEPHLWSSYNMLRKGLQYAATVHSVIIDSTMGYPLVPRTMYQHTVNFHVQADRRTWVTGFSGKSSLPGNARIQHPQKKNTANQLRAS